MYFRTAKVNRGWSDTSFTTRGADPTFLTRFERIDGTRTTGVITQLSEFQMSYRLSITVYVRRFEIIRVWTLWGTGRRSLAGWLLNRVERATYPERFADLNDSTFTSDNDISDFDDEMNAISAADRRF